MVYFSCAHISQLDEQSYIVTITVCTAIMIKDNLHEFKALHT